MILVTTVATTATTAGCGSSDPQPLQTRTCGEDGPAHILLLPHGEHFTLLGESAGRWLVRTGTLGSYRVTSVGPCGEDPQQMAESGELVVGEGRVWVVQRDAQRVGYWPVEGGAVTWIAEGEQPIGVVPGRGYLVLERADETDSFGSAVLVGLDGSRQMLWADVAAESFDPAMGVDEMSARLYAFQVAGDVFGHLDGVGSLRVAHRDDPTAVHSIDGVASFALGPDGSWFVAREDDGVTPRIDQASGATFHVRGSIESVALGRVQAWPDVVHASGWLELRTDDSPGAAIFVAATRTEVAIPQEFVGLLPTDASGGVYAVVDGSMQRWDPFADTTEAKAEVPADFRVTLVNDKAAVHVASTGPIPGGFTETEVTVAPLDGGTTWRVPGLVDGVALLPDGGVVYTPDLGEDADVGPLRWIDREGDPVEIDPSVPATSSVASLLDGDLVYRVEDADRSGVWRAALP